MLVDILRSRAAKMGEGRTVKMKTGKGGVRAENLLRTYSEKLRLAKTRAEKNSVEMNFLMKFQEIQNKNVENHATFMAMMKNVHHPKAERPSSLPRPGRSPRALAARNKIIANLREVQNKYQRAINGIQAKINALGGASRPRP
jgi:hypothetical protein